MGNCLRRNSAMVWANGDSDEWVCVSDIHPSQRPSSEKLALLHEDEFGASSFRRQRPTDCRGGCDQMKIKITKRELEELVESRGGAGDVEQLLVRAMNEDGDEQYDYDVEEHQRPWRPTLHSIPEVN